jgi:hypothetical protein
MRNLLAIIICFSFFHTFSQQGKVFIETNYNTFFHNSLSDFQKEFKADIAPIPVKTLDDFPANIGFTLGYEIIDSNTAIFLAYNSTGGKLSYSDYSGIVRLENALNGISLGAIYYSSLSELKNLRLGIKGFATYSSLNLNSYSEIGNNIEIDEVGFNSIDFGAGVQFEYEYPLSFIILKANIGFDLVFGGKLRFNDNNEAHLINNSNEKVKTGWSGLRTGLGIAFPIN